MLDTLPVKDLVMSTIGATQLPGTAHNFARVVSDDSSYKRLSTHISSISPTILRIAHQPRKNGVGNQRSLIAIDQDLTRVDALSNPISKTRITVALQSTIPSDVTLAEYRTAVSTLLGALLESDGANVTAMFNGEM